MSNSSTSPSIWEYLPVKWLSGGQRLKVFWLTFNPVCINFNTFSKGSKIVPVWSWLQMGRDLILIWLRYSTGAWKLIEDKRK